MSLFTGPDTNEAQYVRSQDGSDYKRDMIPPPQVKYDYAIAPEFTGRLVNKTLTEGRRAKLMCSITGVPHPEISWYKDGHALKDGLKYSIMVRFIIFWMMFYLYIFIRL